MIYLGSGKEAGRRLREALALAASRHTHTVGPGAYVKTVLCVDIGCLATLPRTPIRWRCLSPATWAHRDAVSGLDWASNGLGSWEQANRGPRWRAARGGWSGLGKCFTRKSGWGRADRVKWFGNPCVPGSRPGPGLGVAVHSFCFSRLQAVIKHGWQLTPGRMWKPAVIWLHLLATG